MKKSHIFAIVIIAVAIGIIISTAGDASSYVTFDEAAEIALTGNSNKIHVVGTLKKANNGEIVGLEKSNDMLSCSFIMIDQNSREQKVHYNEPMPADLLKSEQVVVIGSYQDDLFIADQILLKCPSKYEETEITT